MKRRFVRAAVGLTVATAALLGPAQAQAAPFVYVANLLSGDVSQYDVGAGGLLSPLVPSTVAAGTFPSGVAFSPDGRQRLRRRTRAATASPSTTSARAGRFAPKSPPTVAAGDVPGGVAVSPEEGASTSPNERSDSVSQYDVGAGGALTPKSPPPWPRDGPIAWR